MPAGHVPCRMRSRLPLDHSPHDRPARTLMQRAQALGDARVVLSEPTVVAHVIEPRRRAVAFDPDLRIAQVAQQRPAARAVANAYTTPLRHRLEELRNVFLADVVFD